VKACLLAVGCFALFSSRRSEAAEPQPPAQPSAPPEQGPENPNDSSGYTPQSEASSEALRLHGYVDVGFAKAQGNGSSFRAGDTRLPADYGVDTFAPAVNSRGEVASLDAGSRFVNGFLPYSMEIGNRASFFINTVSADLQYTPPGTPLFFFVRTQLLPRFANGTKTRVVVEQAFGRISPISSQEFALSVGKFDSVFGIEYLENQANLRTGITPSLIARYTTGQSIGTKAFYRLQIPAWMSAFSVNAALTNSAGWVESLQTPDISLTGVPNFSARVGYELNQLRFQVKIGASVLFGPRNDQRSSAAGQHAFDADARLTVGWLSLSGEYISLHEDPGVAPGKLTGTGEYPLASGFNVHGFYNQVAVAIPTGAVSLQTATVYARYDRRHAEFEGFGPILTSRVTTGVRLDFWSSLALKAEYLFNRENSGAPPVPNDVFTSSVVFSW
jgi:hypothetical protein